MSKEAEPRGVPITAIHINLKEGLVLFDAGDQTVAKLTFAPEGVIFHQPGQDLETAETLPPAPEPIPQTSAQAESGAKETEPRVTLTGRLKAKPREGRPDRTGKPTAYARFAANVEGRDHPHDYIATFHRHTTKIALGLPKDVQITVDGYAHASNARNRLDTFSVINILNYPGKPKSQK